MDVDHVSPAPRCVGRRDVWRRRGDQCFAVKDQAYGFYLAAPVAVPALLWHREYRGTASGWLHAIVDRRVLAIGLATLIAFAIGQGLLWAPDRFMSHLAFMTSRSVSSFQTYPRSPDGYLQLLWAVGITLTWAAGAPLAAAAAGTIVQMVQRRWVRLAGLLLPLVTYIVGFLAVVLYVYDRFLIGWLPIAAFIGGTFLAWVVQRQTVPRVLRYGVPAILLSVGLLNALAQNAAFRGDARYAAADWLTRHVPCGAPVGVAIDAAYVPPLGCYDVWQFLPTRLDGVARWPDYFVLGQLLTAVTRLRRRRTFPAQSQGRRARVSPRVSQRRRPARVGSAVLGAALPESP